MPDPCHECGKSADENCARCKLPTCPDSYYEMEYLGLCKCCHAEMTSHGLDLVEWPHPLRKPLPAAPPAD